MIRGECELLAGVVQDPVFGPLVAFGLNPVVGQAEGCTVVDARIRVRRPESGPAVKTW